MKHHLTFLVAATVFLFCSCTKHVIFGPSGNGNGPEVGELTIGLDFTEAPSGKAVTAYTGSQEYETKVNKVQILIFDENGRLYAYKNAGTSVSSITMGVAYGNKTVWAVINGPDLSSVSSLSALREKPLDLSANSKTSTTGFIMAGSANCSISSGSTTVAITVSRLVSRVVLQKVNNRLPAVHGTLTLDHVMLINVAGNQNMAGSASVSTWYNKAGRTDSATSAADIINGADRPASHPTLTFAKTGAAINNGGAHTPATPYLFYTYPNPSASDATGWSSTFTSRKTRLVVVATISGRQYFYPVTIDNPQRNKTYTVELTITGLGSTDPDKPVSKTGLEANISVQGWVAGPSYEETI